MSTEFSVSLINAKEFEKWLVKMGTGRVEKVSDAYLNEKCKSMVLQMQEVIGSYQVSVGNYAAWPPLKPESIAAKKEKPGQDVPLLDTEEMKAEVQYFDVGPLKKLIGCTNWKAGYHEYGAPLANVPARPFIRPVVWLNIDDAKMGIRKALVAELRQGYSVT